MKIKVEGEKLIKAVKKLDGIKIVLQSAEDAKEAIHLILRKSGFAQSESYNRLTDITVTPLEEYKTSAVEYQTLYLMDFLFEEGTPLDTKVEAIKSLQDFFNKI